MTFEERIKQLDVEKEHLIAQLNAMIGKQAVLAELIEERDNFELETEED